MTKAVKFTFDESFDGGTAAKRRALIEQRQAEIEAARAEGRTAGIAEGRAAALAEVEAEIAALLEHLSGRAEQLFGQRQALTDSMARAAAGVGHAVGSTLAKHLMESHPLSEIEALVAEAFTLCVGEPRLAIRVAEPMLDPLQARIDKVALAAGFNGKVILLADDRLGRGDCLIEWPDGGVERNVDAIAGQIEAIVRRYLEGDDNNSQPAEQLSDGAELEGSQSDV